MSAAAESPLEALQPVRAACAAAGISAPSGEVAAQRRREGCTFVTEALDLIHLEQTVRAHLDVARTALGPKNPVPRS